MLNGRHMTVKKHKLAWIMFFIGSLVSLLVACGNKISPVLTAPVEVIVTQKSFDSTVTVFPNTQVSMPSPSTTLDPTQQARRSTFQTKTAETKQRQQMWDDEATQAAQFPDTCGYSTFNAFMNSSEISPDGNWMALDCHKKHTMIVQNKQGIRWDLTFTDFLSPDSPEGMPGGLDQKFWSPEGEYLYFAIWLGYSGGGNECFPQQSRGDYGLFRLSLKTGSWVTLIPSTDAFPGYGIEFSPTGRRYAVTINGIMINDLKTGEVANVDVSGVIQGFSWSPDGTHLAYSVASCGEEFLESSSVYVWDALTGQTQMLISTNDMLLIPELWSDNLTLRVVGRKYVSLDTLYTIFIYDISQENLVFTGTATPYR